MPGSGLITIRKYSPQEREAIRTGAEESGLAEQPALEALGSDTCDVYLNGTTFWQNVPEPVWEYRIGGYQVIKKWLSYREHKLLGRALTLDEAEHVTHVVRRIASILLLGSKLDASYASVKANASNWSSIAGKQE
jgi:hypothetical protein